MVCTLYQQKLTQQYHYLYLNDHNDICEAVALQHVQRVPKGQGHQSPTYVIL